MNYKHLIALPDPDGAKLRPIFKYPPEINMGRTGKEIEAFNKWAKENTLPCLGAEVGRIYSREEVEGPIWQTYNWYLLSGDWYDRSEKPDESEMDRSRQIYRLKQKPDQPKQQAETAEEAISASEYIESKYGTANFARSVEGKDAVSIIGLIDEYGLHVLNSQKKVATCSDCGESGVELWQPFGDRLICRSCWIKFIRWRQQQEGNK